ncbi:hypothetical protein [Frigoriglobus tundricola]|uniref:Glycosyltransferase RgtA/B/C/D-like domain-containing protein n=1 Tax=Frigoriglobus tundricola TaxID=2774151 RepID=A0A6M5Z178_9BACT|nr:hypothetical protein [Frigoriglobus tundricola]QJW99506.1 hypothetical protein FTUN_7118 [Frigoriglobus tundricola]
MDETESPTHPHAPPAPQRVPWGHAITAGLLLTALNAVKPVHIDDHVFLAYGAEFAAHPLDPYAFRYGSPYVTPANELLSPPVFLYWLGAGITLVGDRPVYLKLWLAPFALILAGAIAFLSTRLAPTLRVPLVWLGLISPTILPGFNFMLDVPVLALGLTALAVVVRSVERDSWLLALAAGLLAGLAIQTKYTGLVSCATILTYCVLRGRPVRGVAVVTCAVALAVGWECLVALAQGDSHFLVQFRQRQGSPVQRAGHLVLPLFSQVAGLAPAVALLGLKALRWSNRATLLAGAGVATGFALLAIVPSQGALITGSNGKPVLTPSNVVYGLLAALVWGTFARAGWELLRENRTPTAPDRSLNGFLLAWFVLELGGYFALSPFPAARRVVGPVLVMTLVVGRLAHRRSVPPHTAAVIASFGVALALLFFGADVLEARAGKAAAFEVAHGTNRPVEGGTFWHLSWWGFSYYADREGLTPLQLNERALRPGDLLAVHDMPEFLAVLARHPEIVLEQIDAVTTGDEFPLRLAPGYYDGRTPMENRRTGRLHVLVFRVVAVTHR